MKILLSVLLLVLMSGCSYQVSKDQLRINGNYNAESTARSIDRDTNILYCTGLTHDELVNKLREYRSTASITIDDDYPYVMNYSEAKEYATKIAYKVMYYISLDHYHMIRSDDVGCMKLKREMESFVK